jgi:hypothetical protein
MKPADPPAFFVHTPNSKDVWAYAVLFLLAVLLLLGFGLGAVVYLRQDSGRRWLQRGVAEQQELLDGRKRRGLRRPVRPSEDHRQVLLAQPASLPKEPNATPQECGVCGNAFIQDSLYCFKCGERRPQMQTPVPPQLAASAPVSVRQPAPGKQQVASLPAPSPLSGTAWIPSPMAAATAAAAPPSFTPPVQSQSAPGSAVVPACAPPRPASAPGSASAPTLSAVAAPVLGIPQQLYQQPLYQGLRR